MAPDHGPDHADHYQHHEAVAEKAPSREADEYFGDHARCRQDHTKSHTARFYTAGIATDLLCARFVQCLQYPESRH